MTEVILPKGWLKKDIVRAARSMAEWELAALPRSIKIAKANVVRAEERLLKLIRRRQQLIKELRSK